MLAMVRGGDRRMPEITTLASLNMCVVASCTIPSMMSGVAEASASTAVARVSILPSNVAGCAAIASRACSTVSRRVMLALAKSPHWWSLTVGSGTESSMLDASKTCV